MNIPRLSSCVLVGMGILLFGCLFFGGFFDTAVVHPSFGGVEIGKERWELVGIARTLEERQRGLGSLFELPPQRGLLFVFEQSKRHGFWMKDMHFPIDIIFIKDGRVDSVARHLTPGDLRGVYPKGEIDQALEVNAGEAMEVQSGDQVRFPSI